MPFTNIQRFIGRAIVLTSLTLGATHAQTPPPGEYLREEGSGVLQIDIGKKFSIDAAGSNGHSCELGGSISGGKARMDGVDSADLIHANIPVLHR